MTDSLENLNNAGVSIWLDKLSREMITSGELANYVNRHVSGVTTNPTIFSQALSQGHSYDEQLRELAAANASVEKAVFEITTQDVRTACDVLTPVYERTGGTDGRVSIEVQPGYAYDAEATVAEAVELNAHVDRKNVMVKIPATEPGLAAITAATAAGVSVNVTLIFSQERYRQVAHAYVAGLRQAHANGINISQIRSVASLFLSRIDSKVDAALEEIGTDEALQLRGQVAVANARLCNQIAEEVFGESFTELQELGGTPQRPLWASTGTKSPDYRPTLYVDTLIAPNVVNTMPPATLEATAEGLSDTKNSVAGTYEASANTITAVERLGVNLTEIMETLEREGVESFNSSWEELTTMVSNGMENVNDG